MALFTCILEFDGGTYISQFRAASPSRAVAQYTSRLLRDTSVSRLSVRRRLSDALAGENPIAIAGVRNVWCCSSSIGKKLALLNIVAMETRLMNREPDKNENTLNETVTLHLQKSSCLVLYELLSKSYTHWRKSNPDDSSPNPLQLKAEEYADRRALWRLEGAVERAVPELFASDSAALLKESKRLLSLTVDC